jgi:lipopolysaccharide transport system permease protein
LKDLKSVFPFDNFTLLSQLIRREIQQRFKSSVLGLAWYVITPLAMLLVYTLVFKNVLGARWPGSESGAEFALQLYSGLLVFQIFSELIGKAPVLVVEQPNMVKKVVFPLHILPWSSLMAVMLTNLIGFAVLAVGCLYVLGHLSVTLFALPLVLLAFTPLLLGLSWFLAALGVFLRDVQQIVGLILTPLLFLSPVFYPVSALPEFVQPFMAVNPIALIIESVRAVFLLQVWPDFAALAVYFCFGLVLMYLGFWFFNRVRKGFADVL